MSGAIRRIGATAPPPSVQSLTFARCRAAAERRLLEICTVTSAFDVVPPSRRLRVSNPAPLALAAALTLAGCSSFDTVLSGDKIDYKSQATKSATLEVPPDLTQLAREGRYQPQGGVVSAAAMRQPGVQPAVPTATVAPTAIGDFAIHRDGSTRWMTTSMSPEALFPLLRNFWQERGFVLTLDSPETGVMETDWAENRAKLPDDVIRRTLGKVFDSLYSTSERDRFRTRVERLPGGGSEVYISHRGMQETIVNQREGTTMWQPRPADPNLEAEFLSRLMVRLGSTNEVAKTAVARAAEAPARARATSLPATAAMEIDEGFDRAWRRVGQALDRSGFTVEDRDRSAGLYFVRYVDARQVGKTEPNFITKLFRSESEARPQRYRVQVKASGEKSQVTVQNSRGEADNSEPARQIVARLIDDLR